MHSLLLFIILESLCIYAFIDLVIYSMCYLQTCRFSGKIELENQSIYKRMGKHVDKKEIPVLVQIHHQYRAY